MKKTFVILLSTIYLVLSMGFTKYIHQCRLISEKVLAKCGLKLNECSSLDQTKPMLFQIVKIKEKNNMKSSGV